MPPIKVQYSSKLMRPSLFSSRSQMSLSAARRFPVSWGVGREKKRSRSHPGRRGKRGGRVRGGTPRGSGGSRSLGLTVSMWLSSQLSILRKSFLLMRRGFLQQQWRLEYLSKLFTSTWTAHSSSVHSAIAACGHLRGWGSGTGCRGGGHGTLHPAMLEGRRRAAKHHGAIASGTLGWGGSPLPPPPKAKKLAVPACAWCSPYGITPKNPPCYLPRHQPPPHTPSRAAAPARVGQGGNYGAGAAGLRSARAAAAGSQGSLGRNGAGSRAAAAG